MKNSLFSKFKTTLKNIPAMRILVIASFLFFSAPLDLLHAQDPKLSIQGILKKSSGEAIEDGNYNLTFKLYTSPDPGPAPVWTETQTDVEVVSGIYSTVLGNTDTLDIPFNTIYYLGVTVGSAGATEMKPRIQLTSAPYALSLIGTKNKFPSSGQVVADSIDVNGNVLAQMGAPGLNGVNKNGYGFLGDKDSGLYSQGAGQASLYVNNTEEVKVTPDSVRINGDLSLQSGKALSYNGLDDWRLVVFEDFKNGANNWQYYNPSNEYIGWNAQSPGGPAEVNGNNNNYSGSWIMPGFNDTDNRRVLKKEFNLTNAAVGNYEFIKIKFKYYLFDTWDGINQGEVAWAGIAETVGGTQLRVGWMEEFRTWLNYTILGGPSMGGFNAATNIGIGSKPDFSRNAEMTFFRNDNQNSFWLMFGAALGDGFDEEYGVGMIEIWVK